MEDTIVKVKLTDIPVTFICPDSNKKYSNRKKHMISLLSELGFKNVTMYKSSTEQYPKCLKDAYVKVLQNNLNDDPILILEDDVEKTTKFDVNLEYPKDTDAFYLGFSKYGGSKTKNVDEGSSVVDYISSTHIRILNMLTTHAILYITKRYKQAVIDLLSSVNEVYYLDVLISRIQPNFNVYGYYYPIFYQSEKLDNNPIMKEYTNFYYVKSDRVIVTAYYPLAKSKHSQQEYYQWISLFFQCVTAPIVCFCPPEIEGKMRSLMSKSCTLVVRPFNSFQMMSDQQMAIWRNFNKIDPENSYHSPELYAVWAAKQEFVQETIKLINSNIYVWCDIGCFRVRRNNSGFKNVHKFVQPGKISCMSIGTTIGGGVLAGDREAWKMFSKIYLDELKRRPDGKDQNIYKRILNTNNAVILDNSDKYGDAWFHLTSLFSY